MTIPNKIYRTLYVVYFLLYHFRMKKNVRKITLIYSKIRVITFSYAKYIKTVLRWFPVLLGNIPNRYNQT